MELGEVSGTWLLMSAADDDDDYSGMCFSLRLLLLGEDYMSLFHFT